MLRQRGSGRRGTILPMLAVCLVTLVGFVALAIDLGMVMVARNQAQNGADVAAMTYARAIDGSASSNLTNAQAKGKEAAMANGILGSPIQDSEIVFTPGYYSYDQGTTTFTPVLSAPSPPDNYNLTQAVVTRTSDTAFARVFNLTSFTVNAVAIAAHRPRDICIVLDYSGSMNNESDLWNCESYLGSVNNSPNNNDCVVPTFGPYSSSSSTLVNTNSDARVGKSNVTQAFQGFSALVDDFFQNNRGASAAAAFSLGPDGYASTPGGDNFLKVTQNTGATYTQTVSGTVANTTFDQAFEIHGYSGYTVNLSTTSGRWADTSTSPAGIRGFSGYTQGPRYWGKTFMVWPPDPRLAGAISQAQVKTWLRELGYTNNDLILTDTSTPVPRNANQKKVQGIFQTVAGVQPTYSWNTGTPWPANGTALAAYLLTVPRPVNPGNPSSTSDLPSTNPPPNMTTSDATFQKIMGLHDRVNLPDHADWRARFFLPGSGSSPVTDNTVLWDSTGTWKSPSAGNYKINYAKILAWIKQSPCPFPSQLRAGRVLYYDAIPNDIPSTAYTWTNSNASLTSSGSNYNERFWKEYIDWVLGLWRDPYGANRGPGFPECSIGPDFTWGTIAVNGKPSSNATGHLFPQYMNYADNPRRPRHRGWFGPMTMVQFMSDTGIFPGTVHDISMMPAKIGIHAALLDIKSNHPNDLVSLIMFSRPRITGEPSEVGQFSKAQFPLSRDYDGMINALYYPPNSGSSDVRIWDANGLQTPCAHGDYVANTATQYGFMLAYNQLSNSSTLRSQGLGGNGRKGSQRLIVLETDGMANVALNVNFTNSVNAAQGINNSYYNIGSTDTITSGGTPSTVAADAANRLCAPLTGGTYSPGFALPNKPVIIHCVVFGAIFEQSASGSEPDNALALCQSISTIGGTGFPPTRTATTDPNFYKICTGTLDQRRDKLHQAFSKIMDDGVGVALVR
jgi:Flp pilus assembly protein TadG